MASSSSVLEDGSRLSQLDRFLYRFEGWLAVVAGLAALSLMVLAVISVSGRNFFNTPLPGYVDWIEQAVPLIAFLGLSYTQRTGGHIRMDFVLAYFSGRVLWFIEFVTTLVMFVLTIGLIWGSWSHFVRSFDWAAKWWSRDSSIDISIPLWPTKLLVPFVFSVLLLRLFIQLWGYFRALTLKNIAPVAVPIVLSAAAQAAEEAEHVSGADD